MGTNVIVGTDANKIVSEAMRVLNSSNDTHRPQPPLWDGHTADRILAVLQEVSLHG